MKKKLTFHRGFTLVELLVVIVIIAALAALSMTAITRVREAAGRATLVSNMRQLSSAMASFIAEKGAYPSRSSDPKWDRSLLPYLGYTTELDGTDAIKKTTKTGLFEKTASLFASPTDKEKRPTDYFKRSLAIVPWTSNWSDGANFRGWKSLPYNQGVRFSILDRPERSAVLVEAHYGTSATANLVGAGNHEYHDMGGPKTINNGFQHVLFADGHIEKISATMSTEEFIKHYWPGTLGSAN